MKTKFFTIFCFMIISPALLLAAGKKIPGVVFRFDDNHSVDQWRDVVRLFDAVDAKCSFAVISGRLSREQGQLLKSLSDRGFEMMDHTTEHAFYQAKFLLEKDFLAATNCPFAEEFDPRRRTLYFKPEVEWKHEKNFQFHASVQQGKILISDPACDSKITQTKKIWIPSRHSFYGISMKGTDKYLLDFWGRGGKPFDLPDEEMLFVSQEAIQPSKDLLRFQACATRQNLAHFNIPKPVIWIQPGGWEAFLDARRLRDIYGKEFGYIGSDCVLPHQGVWRTAFCCADPDLSRWTQRPNFFCFDEGATLQQMKHKIADTLALRRSLIYISHLRCKRVGGWDRWLTSNAALLAWLREKKIPIETQTQLTLRIYDTVQDPSVNVFPSLQQDIDQDGLPDGIVCEEGATPNLSAGTVSLSKGSRFSVRNLSGIERGKVRFSWRVNGTPGTKFLLQFNLSNQREWFHQNNRPYTLKKQNEVFSEDFTIPSQTEGVTIIFDSQGEIKISNPELRSAP